MTAESGKAATSSKDEQKRIKLKPSVKALYDTLKSVWALALRLKPNLESLPQQLIADACKQMQPSIPGVEGAIEELWNHGLIDRTAKGSVRTFSMNEIKARVTAPGAKRPGLGKKPVAALLKRHTGLEDANGAAATSSIPAPPAPQKTIVLSPVQACLFAAIQRAWTMLTAKNFQGAGVPGKITTALAALAYPDTKSTSNMTQYAGKLKKKGALKRLGSKTRALWLPNNVTVQIGAGQSKIPTYTDKFIQGHVDDFMKTATETAPESSTPPPPAPAKTKPSKTEGATDTIKLGPTDYVTFATFKMAWNLLEAVDSPFRGIPSTVTTEINRRYRPTTDNVAVITTKLSQKGAIKKIDMGSVSHWRPTDNPVQKSSGKSCPFTQLSKNELIMLMAEKLPQVSDALLDLMEDEEPRKQVKMTSTSQVLFEAVVLLWDKLLQSDPQRGLPGKATYAIAKAMWPDVKRPADRLHKLEKEGALANLGTGRNSFWKPEPVTVTIRNQGGAGALPKDLSEAELVAIALQACPELKIPDEEPKSSTDTQDDESTQTASEQQEAPPEGDTPDSPEPQLDSEPDDSEPELEAENPPDLYELVMGVVPRADDAVEPFMRAILAELSAEHQQRLTDRLTLVEPPQLVADREVLHELTARIDELLAEQHALRARVAQQEEEFVASNDDDRVSVASTIYAMALKRKGEADELSSLFS